MKPAGDASPGGVLDTSIPSSRGVSATFAGCARSSATSWPSAHVVLQEREPRRLLHLRIGQALHLLLRLDVGERERREALIPLRRVRAELLAQAAQLHFERRD